MIVLGKEAEDGELAASNENSGEGGANDPDERSVFVKNVDYSADEA